GQQNLRKTLRGAIVFDDRRQADNRDQQQHGQHLNQPKAKRGFESESGDGENTMHAESGRAPCGSQDTAGTVISISVCRAATLVSWWAFVAEAVSGLAAEEASGLRASGRRSVPEVSRGPLCRPEALSPVSRGLPWEA